MTISKVVSLDGAQLLSSELHRGMMCCVAITDSSRDRSLFITSSQLGLRLQCAVGLLTWRP